VKATVDGHVIFAPAATAKDPFATAIDCSEDVANSLEQHIGHEVSEAM
jgi:hypothetical protein